MTTLVRGRFVVSGFGSAGFFVVVFLRMAVLRATFFAAGFFTGVDEGFFGIGKDSLADTTTPRRGAAFKEIQTSATKAMHALSACGER